MLKKFIVLLLIIFFEIQNSFSAIYNKEKTLNTIILAVGVFSLLKSAENIPNPNYFESSLPVGDIDPTTGEQKTITLKVGKRFKNTDNNINFVGGVLLIGIYFFNNYQINKSKKILIEYEKERLDLKYRASF